MRGVRRAVVAALLLALSGCSSSGDHDEPRSAGSSASASNATATRTPSSSASHLPAYSRDQLVAALPTKRSQLAGHELGARCLEGPGCPDSVSVMSDVRVTRHMSAAVGVVAYPRGTQAQMTRLTAACTPEVHTKPSRGKGATAYGRQGVCYRQGVSLEGWTGTLLSSDIRLVPKDGPATDTFHEGVLLLTNGHHLVQVVSGSTADTMAIARGYLRRLTRS